MAIWWQPSHPMQELLQLVDLELAIPAVALLSFGGGMISARVRNYLR